MANAGVSLGAVLAIGIGGVLVYSGVEDPQGGPFGVVKAAFEGRTPTPRSAGGGWLQNLTDTITGAVGNAQLGALVGPGAGLPGVAGLPAAVNAAGLRLKVVNAGMAYIGVPYKWAGEDKRGVDCSGLVLVAYRDGIGVKLPHKASAQAARGKAIKRSEVQAGDLVAWGPPGAYSHIALAIDNQRCLNAQTFGTKVKITPIDIEMVPGYGKVPACFKLIP